MRKILALITSGRAALGNLETLVKVVAIGAVAGFAAVAGGHGVMLPAVHAQDAAIIDYSSRLHPTLGKNGMVVSQDHLASDAGIEILKQGGNAVDAAVATGFALAVTHPQAGNIGGGGFMMVYLKDLGRTVAIDFREMAPAAAHRDMFLDASGKVDNSLVRTSMLASGVPGSVAGLLHALDTYGSLPRAVVMAPAIRLAEDGIEVNFALAQSLARFGQRLSANAASRSYFFKADGSSYQPGDRLVQADLAKTLKAIAKDGRDGFYKGWVAEAILAAQAADGGIITQADLDGYKVVERDTVSGQYGEYRVVSMPPPSSGGVHIIQMLNVLTGYKLREMGLNSAAYLHRMVETTKRAYADRSKYLGDPDFFDVPVAALTDPKYADVIRASIPLDKATPSSDIGPAPALPYESTETTHFSVADKDGNVVSSTYTLNFSYGNGKSVPGAGFLMNNEMDDFSAKPGTPNAFGLLGGEANAIEAGKRPLSSMTPTIVFKQDKPFLVTGSPGGSTIITTVLQMVMNVMVFDMNVAAATYAPRVHHQWYPDRLFMEPGHSVDTQAILRSMGHPVKNDPLNPWDRVLGATQSIIVGEDGVLRGTSSPRRPGSKASAY